MVLNDVLKYLILNSFVIIFPLPSYMCVDKY